MIRNGCIARGLRKGVVGFGGHVFWKNEDADPSNCFCFVLVDLRG